MTEIVAAPDRTSRRILLILGLVAALYQLVANAAWVAVFRDAVPVGAFEMTLGACDADRFCDVKAVEPGPASAAGVRAGDRLRFDDSLDALRQFYAAYRPGDRAGVTVRRGGVTRHVEMAAASSAFGKSGDLAAEQMSSGVKTAVVILTVIAGVFVMMRAGGRLSALLLGAGLVCIGADNPSMPFWWWRDPVLYSACNAWVDITWGAAPILIFAFARAFRREASEHDGALGRWSLRGLAVAMGAWTILFEGLTQTGVIQSRDILTFNWITVALADAGFILALLTLAAGWREAARADKARYGYLMPAVLLIAMMHILFWLPWVFGDFDPAKNPVVVAMDVLPLAGLLLFVYAVLRHRVIDLGFAVNRTLVYGVVSAVLLAAFGLIEWGVDHFVPIEGREKNALVDAAIALGVFLTFHRVRDGVEHGIERLFFRRWQQAEAELRRFVREAAFVTEGAALTRAFAQALAQFGEDAQTAVYLREGRDYVRVAGEVAGEVAGVGARLEANLPPLVSLRADPKPSEIQDGALAGALIAPMVNRNDVLGVVLLGAKPSGHGWRPDEVELIGWATRQVGLDLHALEVERLEAVAVEQREQMARIEARNQELRLALGARSPA